MDAVDVACVVDSTDASYFVVVGDVADVVDASYVDAYVVQIDDLVAYQVAPLEPFQVLVVAYHLAYH